MDRRTRYIIVNYSKEKSLEKYAASLIKNDIIYSYPWRYFTIFVYWGNFYRKQVLHALQTKINHSNS